MKNFFSKLAACVLLALCIPIFAETGAGKPNTAKVTYNLVSGGTMTNQAEGKPKILVFFMASDSKSRTTAQNFASSIDDFSAVDICFVEVKRSSKSIVTKFRDSYGSAKLNVAYETKNTAQKSMNDYAKILIGGAASVPSPMVVYIDSNNKIQLEEHGQKFTASHVKEVLSDYLGVAAQTSVVAQPLSDVEVMNGITAFYIDDKAEIVPEIKKKLESNSLQRTIPLLSDVNGWSIDWSNPNNLVHLQKGNKEAYYRLECQYIDSCPDGLEEEIGNCIKKLYAKVDPSINLARKYVSSDKTELLPISRRTEIREKLDGTYDWQKDKEFADFVNWMRKRKVKEKIVQMYIDAARDPFQRGFFVECKEENVFFFISGPSGRESFFYVGPDQFAITQKEDCKISMARRNLSGIKIPFAAGGMEKYFLFRKIRNNSLFQQKTVPVVFVHYTDTDTTPDPGLGEKVEVNDENIKKYMAGCKAAFDSVMPNNLECYFAAVPISYRERRKFWQDSLNDLGTYMDKWIEWEQKTVLSYFKKTNPTIAKNLEGRDFATAPWYDNWGGIAGGMSGDGWMKEYPLWALFTVLGNHCDNLDNHGAKTFIYKKNRTLNEIHCVNLDCEHMDAICPLCLYALGY